MARRKARSRSDRGPDRHARIFFRTVSEMSNPGHLVLKSGCISTSHGSTKHGGHEIGSNCGVLHATRPSANMFMIPVFVAVPFGLQARGARQLMRVLSY